MDLIYILDLIGTMAFAISGTLSAMEKRFDLFGALFIAFLTAVGGGTVRDCLIGSTPVTWMQTPNYILAIVLGVLVTIIFKRDVLRLKKTLFLFDTIGIAIFTVIGIEKGLDFGLPAYSAIMMGVSTAVVGGALRDVFCNDIPLIFHREVYATACLIGGILYAVLHYWGCNENLIIPLTTATIIIIRLLSVKYNWSLPKTTLNDD
ncbi:trimeric intracellular cation channel family protein [Halosquirtibacter xylanolyticus]|uniref:trimeric intracellular cation channel family protein n=1 Tax=Halosquirtibacter xylanolyticus TaxID=3374599 RepID=UPI003749D664|nr:trimeric intracellular cation channel family protein [Prolixibacteraceae bacterium]